MAADRRYNIAKDLISAGKITSFHRIFEIVPKSVVYKDMGINYNRFTKLMANPDLFTLRELSTIAKLIGVDPKTIIDLAYDTLKPKKKG
ncbi:MAG: hypothetical protein BGO55_14930 [Sphingobacteriales bacterium 50-39]|nr:hypothetical protein [Sphingobacteriales bacterium]OJW57572.1 MAG: hypothetical protein BGO55_14930 [Sphingobacteriales bacterium 50-39]